MFRMTENLDNDVNVLEETDDFQNIQPHLGSLTLNDASGLEQINPAFDDGDDTVTTDNQTNVSISNASTNQKQSNSPQSDNLDSKFPVIYSNSGQQGISQGHVVIKNPDGTKVIKTEDCCQYTAQPYTKRQKPLTKKRMLVLKILSVVAVVVFFPLGIPAAYFAFNVQKEFDEGIIKGNIDKAQKYAGRAEKLIIFAGMFAVLTLVLVISVVERFKDSDNETSNVKNRVIG